MARYLLELDEELAVAPSERARALREVEHHLNDATADGIARGLSQSDAEEAAIGRFGSPSAVAEAFASEAGLHAAPYTMLHRLDVWRASHLWLGALLPLVPLLALQQAMGVVFALSTPAQYRGPLLRNPLGVPVIPALVAGLVVGQVLIGYSVRDREERTFSRRVAWLRHHHPMRVAVFGMGPFVVAWELALLASDSMAGPNWWKPLMFMAIPVASAVMKTGPAIRFPKGGFALALAGGFAVGVLAAVGLSMRVALAAACGAAILGVGQFAQRRWWASSIGQWRNAIALGLCMAAAMAVFTSIAFGRAMPTLLPFGYVVVITPLLAWSFSRTTTEAERARLTQDAKE